MSPPGVESLRDLVHQVSHLGMSMQDIFPGITPQIVNEMNVHTCRLDTRNELHQETTLAGRVSISSVTWNLLRFSGKLYRPRTQSQAEGKIHRVGYLFRGIQPHSVTPNLFSRVRLRDFHPGTTHSPVTSHTVATCALGQRSNPYVWSNNINIFIHYPYIYHKPTSAIITHMELNNK